MLDNDKKVKEEIRYRYIYVAEKSKMKAAKNVILHVMLQNQIIAVIVGGKFETENTKLAGQLKKLGYNMAKMVIEDEDEE